jgi:adenosylcobinamide-phosphate synthase
MGKVAGWFKPKIKNENPMIEKLSGVLLCLFLGILFVVPVGLLLFWVRVFFGWLPYVVVGALVFQATFAVKCMRQYTLPVAEALDKEDYGRVKELFPFIVRRSPEGLTRQHMVSAAVETIAEGCTDGITSPFFYFALFGVPGAVAFRVINTLDSMVGYKDQEHINIGWFSAKMDTLVNYVPARLTGCLMVLAALVLGNDWKNGWKILWRDQKNMVSPNAGWTIATMAGLLNVRLEKPGYYAVGDEGELKTGHIVEALRVMVVTAVLFGVLVVLPLLIVKGLIIAGL